MKSYLLFYLLFFGILISGCEKEKNIRTKTPPIIKDIVLDGVLNNAAKFSISLEQGTLPLIETGVCWDTVINPTIKGGNFKPAESAINYVYDYKCLVSGLALETQYYSRVYALTAVDTVYSSRQISFQTDSGIDTFKFTATVKGVDGECIGTIFAVYLLSFDENSTIKDGNYEPSI